MLSFTSYIVVNIIVLIPAIPYWVLVDFDATLFWIGVVGSIINTLGLVAVQNALSTGPSGPVSALCTVNNVLLVIVESIKTGKVPNPYEFAGLFAGMFGALILVIPEYLCCCCMSKKKDEEEDKKGEGNKVEMDRLLPNEQSN